MTSSSEAAEAGCEYKDKLSAAVAVPAINLDFMLAPHALRVPLGGYPATDSKHASVLSNYNQLLTMVRRIQSCVAIASQRKFFQQTRAMSHSRSTAACRGARRRLVVDRSVESAASIGNRSSHLAVDEIAGPSRPAKS